MSRPHLRIYNGPDAISDAISEAISEAKAGPASYTNISLAEFVETLKSADGRAWLKDFADERIRISTDLYDVLATFQTFHNSPTPRDDTSSDSVKSA